MSEIVPYIILILVLLVLELIQISCSRSKIKKWILPILTFLLSIFVIGVCIAIEINHTAPGTPKNKLGDVTMGGTLMMFLVLNIPTIMFIVTNVIVKKKQL